MKINSLGTKIGGGFLLSAFLLSMVVTVTLYLVSSISSKSEQLFDTDMPINHHSLNIQSQVNRALASLRGWVSLADEDYQREFDQAWEKIGTSLATLSRLIHAKDSQYSKDKFDLLERELEQLHQYQLQIKDIAHSIDNRPGMKIFAQQAAPLATNINNSISAMIELEVLEADRQDRKLLLKSMADFRGSMANSIAAIRGFLLTADLEFKSKFDRFWQLNEVSFTYLDNNQALLTKEQQLNLVQIRRMRERFIPHVEQMLSFRQSADWDQAEKWMKNHTAPLEKSIRSRINQLVEFEKNTMDAQLANIKQNYSSFVSITGLLLFIGILLSVGLALYITKLVVKPLSEVIQLADDIGKGDLTKKVELKGAFEIEQLSRALQNMLAILHKVTNHANTVAQGNYSADFVPQSESDRLGIALKTMTQYLRQANTQTTEQDWLKTGQSGMSERLRESGSIKDLCDTSITFLCRYLDARVGALYLKEQSEFVLSSSFAYQSRSNNDTRFSYGQGMVGQVAKESKLIVFQDVPNEHVFLQMNSGLGDSKPQCIVVFPVINQQQKSDEVLAVVALGLNQTASSIELELLNKLSGAIAAAIATANSQLKQQALLVESQQQTEQLKEQQEELAASNAELEEQATNLSQAEEELRAQREDLQKSNEALREKTVKLEQQNEEIEAKNKVVEESKNQLEKRAFELEQASKYKSEFLANMSHELRTPLNSLLILSQIMAENKIGNLTTEQVEDIKMIHNGGESLLTLINDILDLSKVEAGKLKLLPETFELGAFTKKLSSQFSCMAEDKGIEFVVELAPELPTTFTTDKLRLEQVLRNLISNAIKFTEQGSVTLNISNLTQDHAEPTLAHTLKANNFIIFQVRDTGVGIPFEKQKDIFEAFQQGDGSTSRKYGGTGLGLTISRELTHLLEAEMTLESTEGKGSTFTLYLPVNPSFVEKSVEADLAPDASNLPTSLYAVPESDLTDPNATPYIEDDRHCLTADDNVLLVVEDDKAFAKTLYDFAHTNGFKCLVTNKGLDALELVMTYPPHAVLLDLGLPDIDGLKVLDGLKQSPMTKDIPVHVISGQDHDEVVLRKGAISFLTKPASAEALDQLFNQFSEISLEDYRQILLIEDDEMSCHAIRSYLEENNIAITSVTNGNDGLALLKQQDFDCIVLDLNLTTMTGQEWLELAIQQNPSIPPVIIYTGKDLSNEEYQNLQQYTNSIVLKGSQSQNRLKDEVSLFLYDVESKRPPTEYSPIDIENVETKLDGKRVLVVDDDIRNVYALSKVLKEYGMEVIIADNGELALDKLAQDQMVDLILMDIMMPKMDGFEAIKHIRTKYRDRHPIIALTAKAMPEDRDNCIKAGANDYLAKPVDINRLVSMVKVWLYQ